MKAIDRVMRSYLSTHKLSDEKVELVKIELSNFIDGPMSGEVSVSPVGKTSESF